MAATTADADVCNMALGLCGQRQTIDSLEESSTEARVCKTYFKTTRNKLLASFPWTFAKKRANLALVADETRDGWAYVYQRPADCLSPRFLYTGDDNPPPECQVPFDQELRTDLGGSLILTNQDNAVLIYTVVPPNALWSDHFSDALAAALAVRVAMMLPVKPELGLNLINYAKAVLSEAKAQDGNSVTQSPPPDAGQIRIRE